MKIYSIVVHPDKAKLTYTNTSTGKTERMLTIKIGDTFKIEPDNPLKLKHRGRTCKIHGFIKTNDGTKAKVIFQDNNRHGRVELEDLKVI
ncbi:hypothetical protein D3C74_186470 [compost metagenome]